MKKIYQHPRLRVVAFIESELLSCSTQIQPQMNVRLREYNTYDAVSPYANSDSDSDSAPDYSLGTGSDF